MVEPNLLVKRDKIIQPMMWWETRGLTHPLNDADFLTAFCEYIFCTTSDNSVRIIRSRVFRFIRNFMAPEFQKNLTEYRKHH